MCGKTRAAPLFRRPATHCPTLATTSSKGPRAASPFACSGTLPPSNGAVRSGGRRSGGTRVSKVCIPVLTRSIWGERCEELEARQRPRVGKRLHAAEVPFELLHPYPQRSRLLLQQRFAQCSARSSRQRGTVTTQRAKAPSARLRAVPALREEPLLLCHLRLERPQQEGRLGARPLSYNGRRLRRDGGRRAPCKAWRPSRTWLVSARYKWCRWGHWP